MAKYETKNLLSAQLNTTFYTADVVDSIETGLEKQVTGLQNKIDSLSGESHSHSNKAVLDGITSEAVAAWGSAEQNAKDYADDEIAALSDLYDAKGAADEALSSANAYTDTKVAEEVGKIIDSAPETYDTLKEIADWIANDESGTTALTNRVAALESGKADLSTVTEIGSNAAQTAATLDAHLLSADAHVTTAEKTTWNGKQDALTDAQLSAVNSGIDATWKTVMDNWKTGTQGAIDGITTALSAKASQSDMAQAQVDITNLTNNVDGIGNALVSANGLSRLATDGSTNIAAIILKVNALLDALNPVPANVGG